MQKPEKKTLEPLDLQATVGQSCVSVNVSVLVSDCVGSEERRCGVVTLKSLKKTHIYSRFQISLSLYKYHNQNHKTNGSFTFIP